MESAITSQKSVADITDPLLKSVINDITSILRGEMIQSISAMQNPAVFTKPFVSNLFSATPKKFSELPTDQQDHLKILKKSLVNNKTLSNDLLRLGVDLKMEVPASKQINYADKFAYLKGKADLLSTKLDQIGRTQVIPSVFYPDSDVSKLVKQLKSKDKEAGTYADYLYLLDKPKLVELYKKEISPINSTADLASVELVENDVTKMRRLTRIWEGSSMFPQLEYKKYKNRFLNLKVTRVKCVDETEHEGVLFIGGEGITNDRIDLGAVSFAHNGEVSRFGPQMVSDNFEDRREFAFERQIAQFDLAQMGSYPLNFGTTVTIAEIDYGAGFANTINDIFNNIKGVIVEVLAKIGEIVGSLVGSGEIGKVVGKIVGDLLVLGLGELINIISRAVQDDVFPPQTLTIQLGSKFSSPIGVVDKYEGPFMFPEQRLVFNGHGGSYEVYCAWELIREPA